MAKGQKRSNREAKKPKKTAAEKSKTAGASPFSLAPITMSKPQRKRF